MPLPARWVLPGTCLPATLKVTDFIRKVAGGLGGGVLSLYLPCECEDLGSELSRSYKSWVLHNVSGLLAEKVEMVDPWSSLVSQLSYRGESQVQ